MQSQIINTHTITREVMEMSYQVPDGAGISDIKLIVNNYEGVGKEDTIIIWTVGEQGWQYSGSDLVWIATGIVVTQDEKDQRQLYRGTLKDYERYVEGDLFLGSGDQIRVYSTRGYCNLIAYGDIDPHQDRVNELKNFVVLGTATQAEKEELALLSGGALQINNNNNTNNCSCA